MTIFFKNLKSAIFISLTCKYGPRFFVGYNFLSHAKSQKNVTYISEKDGTTEK